MSDMKNTKQAQTSSDDPLDTLLDQYQSSTTSDELHAQIMAKVEADMVAHAMPHKHASSTLLESWLLFLQNIGGWRVLAPALSISLCIGVFAPLIIAGAQGPASASNTSLWDLAMLTEEYQDHE